MTTTAPVPDLDTAAGVLAFARDRRAAADAAEVDLLRAAVTWADLHPAESIHDAALLSRHGDQPLAVAGPGAPLVAEFCVAEFAAAVGLPTETGKAYLGEALELRHRLPRTWTRVQAGDLPAWRARRIARHTIGLSPAAAGFVDDQVAPFAHRIRPTGVDRLVQEAIIRYMPAEARRRREAAADARHAHVHTDQVSFEGTVWVEAEVDLADALDLDTALSARCRPVGRPRLHRLPGRAPLRDPRRDGPAPARPGPRHRDQYRDLRRREVVLHVHLTEQAIAAPGGEAAPGPGGEHPLVRGRRPGPRLVRPPRRHGDREAGGRPERTHPRRAVPGPRPARRPGSASGT